MIGARKPGGDRREVLCSIRYATEARNRSLRLAVKARDQRFRRAACHFRFTTAACGWRLQREVRGAVDEAARVR